MTLGKVLGLPDDWALLVFGVVVVGFGIHRIFGSKARWK